MSDPRVDEETMHYWNILTETLRAKVIALPGDPILTGALLDVLDLHIAWEKREQQVGPNAGPDRILGVGCRSCDWRPSARVPVAFRPCMTIQRIEARLASA